MRILFTIPHYYKAGGGQYGSLKSDPRPRRHALRTAIFGLHAAFGLRQALYVRRAPASNDILSAAIDVVVCTTHGAHVLNDLGLPDSYFRHHATQAEPMYLGFECHAMLRQELGNYDYYCYLEDDLLITDPLFMKKIAWFNRLAGDDAVLQPNRFEIAVTQPLDKLYIDGNLAKPELSTRLQNVSDRTVITAEAFGTEMKFQRVNNPHSGCFFLNARQMEHWTAQPEFLNRDPSFAGPLESAATLGIMHFFRAYKPARENAGFLEVRHLDNRYLGTRVKGAVRPTQRTAP